MDNSEKEQREEALKPQVFNDADVFYGMYDSDVTAIPKEKEDVKTKVEGLLKIKDLNERQYTALRYMKMYRFIFPEIWAAAIS